VRYCLSLGALALLGCASNPLKPDPNLSLPERGNRVKTLDAFVANLDLTDAIAASAVRPPAASELVDAQVAAMNAHVLSRTGRDVLMGTQAPSIPSMSTDRGRLGEAALALLPYLPIDSGEVELGRVAARALAEKLGSDAELTQTGPAAKGSIDFANDLRDGVGVLRMRRLTDNAYDRALSALNQWAALPSPPRAILLDVTECELADPPDTTRLVNALSPGQTVFQLEYRDEDTLKVERSVWRGEEGWGVSALARVPLFVWLSGRSSSLLESAAAVLREQRGATLLGSKTSGRGRLMSWRRLSDSQWFGFAVAYVLDAQGAPRDQPLYPDACPAHGELTSLADRTSGGYDAACGEPGTPLALEAVLRYVTAASSAAL
jgi:hypothetical protein